MDTKAEDTSSVGPVGSQLHFHLDSTIPTYVWYCTYGGYEYFRAIDIRVHNLAVRSQRALKSS